MTSVIYFIITIQMLVILMWHPIWHARVYSLDLNTTKMRSGVWTAGHWLTHCSCYSVLCLSVGKGTTRRAVMHGKSGCPRVIMWRLPLVRNPMGMANNSLDAREELAPVCSQCLARQRHALPNAIDLPANELWNPDVNRVPLQIEKVPMWITKLAPHVMHYKNHWSFS
jgi:hypothetical protein